MRRRQTMLKKIVVTAATSKLSLWIANHFIHLYIVLYICLVLVCLSSKPSKDAELLAREEAAAAQGYGVAPPAKEKKKKKKKKSKK